MLETTIIMIITTFMDFAGQIRAARAYLNVTQDQLADLADLSLQGIQKIERGESQPTARTQAKITKAFERKGINFTADGITYVENPVLFVTGKTHEDCYLQLLEDVLERLQSRRNAELLIMYADDTVSPPAVNEMYRRIRKSGIKMRQLVEEGNTHLIGPLDEYRYIPKAYFINRVMLIYADCVASESTDFNKAMIRIDPFAAETQRNAFNMLWNFLNKPTKSTANERFE